MNLSVRQMEAFQAVFRLGSMTRAADHLNLTQSAISILIRQMEENLGLSLFERTTRSLKPTQAAHDAVADVERLLRDLDQLGSKLRGLADKSRGNVSVAMSAGLAAGWGGAILSIFIRRYPGILVRLHDVAPNQLVGRVINEDVEFGIGAMELNRKDVSQEILVTDTISAVGLRSQGFARRSTMAWEEVFKLPTIATPSSEPLRIFIDKMLEQHELRLEPTYEVSFLNTALSMAGHGLGVAIMPSNLLPSFLRPMLMDVPLVSPTIHRHLCLIKKTGALLSPAAQSFAAIAKQILMTQTTPDHHFDPQQK